MVPRNRTMRHFYRFSTGVKVVIALCFAALGVIGYVAVKFILTALGVLF